MGPNTPLQKKEADGISSSTQITPQRVFALWLVFTCLAGLVMAVVARAFTCPYPQSRPNAGQPVGHLLRSMPAGKGTPIPLHKSSKWLDGTTVYRVIPGEFPTGMEYHFDGLAMVMAFKFQDGQLQYDAAHYNSKLHRQYNRCLFLGTGTGPTAGYQLCWQNPAVNLLPINGQLWLTVDSQYWGRVDPDTLETLPAKVEATSLVLNAHPACDPATKECYVQYSCDPMQIPYTKQACIGLLVPGENNLQVKEVAKVTLPQAMLIQHSHSLCVTPNYFVAKLEAFELRPSCPDFPLHGMLRVLHQAEQNVWIVMHRKTLEVRVMSSGNHSFINNHFWNCYEKDGAVVTETVGASGDYLDAYFRDSLGRPLVWDDLLYPPLKCIIPPEGQMIHCSPMLKDPTVLFDYPTFNPRHKMDPEYRWVYGVTIDNRRSRFYDSLIKINVQTGMVTHRWSGSDLYVTEADFIPRPRATAEDDGVLVSVVYNSTQDLSAIFIFDAADLRLLDVYPLDRVVPFHAHGIVCLDGSRRCFTNP